MKVLFLNPPDTEEGTFIRDTLYGCFTKAKAKYMWPPVHLAQLAACVMKHDVKCKIIDSIAQDLDYDGCTRIIQRFRPDFVVIITATAAFDSDARYVLHVKKRLSDLKSIFIGTHVSLYTKKCMENPAVDYIIRGEPEVAIQDLFSNILKKQEPKDVPGIAYKKNGSVKITSPPKRIENPDVLPFPARELIPKADYFNPLVKRTPYTTMISSRGCPFPCIFCVAGLTYGKRFIARSPKSMVDEIVECQKKFGIKEIFFRDEEFTMEKKRVADFCDELRRRRVRITWICNSHINTLSKELLAKMKSAGCHMIKIGVESGDDEVLKRIKKGTNRKSIRRVFRWLHELKIDSIGHFMIGAPGETKKTIMRTIRFAKEIDPTYVSFNIATPYPGTKMWEEVEDKIKEKKITRHTMNSALVRGSFSEILCGISEKEMDRFYDYAHRSFYMRPSYLFKRLLRQSSLSELRRSLSAGVHLLTKGIKNR